MEICWLLSSFRQRPSVSVPSSCAEVKDRATRVGVLIVSVGRGMDLSVNDHVDLDAGTHHTPASVHCCVFLGLRKVIMVYSLRLLVIRRCGALGEFPRIVRKSLLCQTLLAYLACRASGPVFVLASEGVGAGHFFRDGDLLTLYEGCQVSGWEQV